jgi:hypothetical protein
MRPTIQRTFHCSNLLTQSDVILIREAMENTPAVVDMEISLANRTIHVVLGDPDGEPSVRHHLQSAGFEIEG